MLQFSHAILDEINEGGFGRWFFKQFTKKSIPFITGLLSV